MPVIEVVCELKASSVDGKGEIDQRLEAYMHFDVGELFRVAMVDVGEDWLSRLNAMMEIAEVPGRPHYRAVETMVEIGLDAVAALARVVMSEIVAKDHHLTRVEEVAGRRLGMNFQVKDHP